MSRRTKQEREIVFGSPRKKYRDACDTPVMRQAERVGLVSLALNSTAQESTLGSDSLSAPRSRSLDSSGRDGSASLPDSSSSHFPRAMLMKNSRSCVGGGDCANPEPMSREGAMRRKEVRALRCMFCED